MESAEASARPHGLRMAVTVRTPIVGETRMDADSVYHRIVCRVDSFLDNVALPIRDVPQVFCDSGDSVSGCPAPYSTYACPQSLRVGRKVADIVCTS